MDIGKNLAITVIGLGIVSMAIAYFIIVRQDGSVLLSLSSVLGGLAGYLVGKKEGE